MASGFAACDGGGAAGSGVATDESAREEACEPAPLDLTGLFAVQATLNVAVDSPAIGVPIPPATSSILLLAGMAQEGEAVAITAQICQIEIPAVVLENSDEAITFEPHEDLVASIGASTSRGRLGATETCATFQGDPITAVAGAVLATPDAPLPETCCEGGTDGQPPTCARTAPSVAACACDQEGDGHCGATVYAHNTPVPIDEIYVTLRTSFALDGTVPSGDRIEGKVVTPEGARLIEQSVVGCSRGGEPCIQGFVDAVRSLNPIITQNPDEPSTFLGRRVAGDLDCAGFVAIRDSLFR
ncbi:MAG: hypothetical protein AABZ30_10275 [Myxococcota bacterium]